MLLNYSVVFAFLLQGYNGSQAWDTSFAVQAIISTNLAKEYGPTLRKAHEYIKDSQVCLGQKITLSYNDSSNYPRLTYTLLGRS